MATTHQHRSHRTTITVSSLSQLISDQHHWGDFLGVCARNYTMMMEMMLMMQPLTPFHGEQDSSFPAFRSLGFW
jgi:hypothetical protein